jgi:hypothetical protein
MSSGKLIVLIKYFCYFSQSTNHINGWNLKLDHDHFLINPLQYIIHYYSTAYTLGLGYPKRCYIN